MDVFKKLINTFHFFFRLVGVDELKIHYINILKF